MSGYDSIIKEVAGMENKALEQEIKASLVNGKLPCAVAFRIAKKLKVSPREVGDVANELKIKISSCQLGCFP
jgi:arginyl-tRNA synthetase